MEIKQNQNQNQFLLNSDNAKYNSDAKILSIKRRDKRKVIQNQLIFLSIIETIVFISQIIVFSFKYWYQYHFILDDRVIWINLIFIDDYFLYSTYCQKEGCDTLLESNLEQVGLLCFILMVIALLLLALEIFRMIALMFDKLSIINRTFKGKLLQPIILAILISTYGGYILIILVLMTKNQNVKQFGICYWIGMGSVFVFCLCLIYYRKVKGTIFRNRQISQFLKIENLQDSFLS